MTLRVLHINPKEAHSCRICSAVDSWVKPRKLGVSERRSTSGTVPPPFGPVRLERLSDSLRGGSVLRDVE